MEFLSIIFFVALGLIFYTYAGYGIVLRIAALFKQERTFEPVKEPRIVTIIIPAYNEKAVLEEKIRNTLQLNYPATHREILLITDGSNDGSEKMFSNLNEVHHLHLPERQGKTAAINRAVKLAKGELIVLTDANTLLHADSLQLMVRKFDNPKVGGVSGEKRVQQHASRQSSTGNEGLYWRYESQLKKFSAKFYTIVGAAGEFFSFRRNLFQPIPPDTILDDFVLSTSLLKQGYIVDYESEAYATESPSIRIRDEFSRKVRISAGVFQMLTRQTFLFNPFFHTAVWFQFISHRFLRWTVAPVCLLACYIISAILGMEGYTAYGIFFYIATGFILWALIGWIFRNRKFSIPGFFIPFYFFMMNVAVVVGLWDFIRGRHSVLWKKAER